MKSLFLMTVGVILSGLLLTPALLYAETQRTADGQPPISQPLVREGALALRLVVALKVGTTSDEAEAEGLLGAVGIAPRNGWIADYPVTPDIVSELQSAVVDAADSGRLSAGRDEASRVFQEVMLAYDLSVRPFSDQYAGAGSYDQPDPTVIHNYYYNEGPPVVTYYTPPPYYYPLYTWVPYPFWWWDFWFPGFFVLADFHIGVHGHGHHRHGEFVTNHFRHPGTGRISRIDPANRIHGGTFAERGARGWSGTSARNGAEAVSSSSRNLAPAGRHGMPASTSGNGRVFRSSQNRDRTSSLPSVTRRTALPSSGSERMFNASVSRRTSVSPSDRRRDFSASSANRRTSVAPSGSSRTFSASPAVHRSFSSPSGGGRMFSSSSGGTFGSFGRGSSGSFGGGHRR